MVHPGNVAQVVGRIQEEIEGDLFFLLVKEPYSVIMMNTWNARRMSGPNRNSRSWPEDYDMVVIVYPNW